MYGAIMRPDRRVLGSVHLLPAVRTPAAGEALPWCCGVFSQSLNCKEILYVVGYITFLHISNLSHCLRLYIHTTVEVRLAPRRARQR